MMRKVIVFGISLVLGFAAPSFSQTPREKEAREFEKKARELREQEMEEIRKRTRRIDEESLLNLKKYDPSAYAARVKMQGLSQKISEVVTSFRQGQLNEGEARKRLTPLVKETLESRIKNLDKEIEVTSRKLDYLKKAKANPSVLINQYVDSYLGKRDLLEDMSYR